MKTLPFFALFFIMIIGSSYVSTTIDAAAKNNAPAGSFKQFRVLRKGGDVSLSWSVSPSKVIEFAVERSYDGKRFETIGALGCNGTTTYQYHDIDVTAGTVYYRVAAVHADESVESSAVEAARNTGRS
jgi:hypothetical protein